MKKKKIKMISGEEFDKMFDQGKDITPYMDMDKVVVNRPDIQRVNVDFPTWMMKRLDQEAAKLNISRQAVIKMWINDRLNQALQFESTVHRFKSKYRKTLEKLAKPKHGGAK